MTKLTLSVDEDIMRKAKEIAGANRTSVSAMFSQFVRSMAAKRSGPPQLAPLTRKLSGVLRMPAGKDDKEALAEAMMERYGIKK